MGVLCGEERMTQLQQSLDSILKQSYRDFEFLICDDGSDQKIKVMLDQYSSKDARVQLVRPGRKLHLAEKLNACLEEANGRFIARMDDDDVSRPDRFEKQLQQLTDEPEISFVGSNVVLRRNGDICGKWVFPKYPEVRDFYITQPFIHPVLMFRKDCLDEVGGYSESRRQVLCEDYDLLLRLYARGYVGENIQEDLLEYTIPDSARGKRTMVHRWNETVTRWLRFRELGLLSRTLLYVFKPMAVGMLPELILKRIKSRKNGFQF